MYTVRKEMKYSGRPEILHKLVHDTTWISSWFSDFRVVSWTTEIREVYRYPRYISFYFGQCTYILCYIFVHIIVYKLLISCLVKEKCSVTSRTQTLFPLLTALQSTLQYIPHVCVSVAQRDKKRETTNNRITSQSQKNHEKLQTNALLANHHETMWGQSRESCSWKQACANHKTITAYANLEVFHC